MAHEATRAGWRAAVARLLGSGRAARRLAGCPDLVAEIDRTGRVVFASAACRALTGRAPGALAGRPLAELVHPEDRAGVAALMAGGGALVHRLAHADGRWLWVETRASAPGPRAGSAVVATIRDAAARQDVEAALRASRAHYRALADTLPQLVWMERTDTGETVYANPAFERYFDGIGPGRALREERCHPDDRPRIEAALAQGGSGEAQGRLRDRTGAYRWHQLSFQPLRKDDRLLGWLGSALDIDEILAARKALEETGDLLRLAQDAAGAGLFDLDLVTREIILAPESARLHGLPGDRPAVLALGAWLRRLAPPDRKPALEALRGAVAGGGTFDIAFRVVLPGGTRWIQAIGRLGRDPAGRALRVTGLNLDISARKDAEAGLVAAKAAAEAAKAAAERANAAKTDFLSAMSHEIRTPLNAVIGFTGLLAQADGLEPELRRYAALARASAGGLLTLVNDILDFSSVEAGAVSLRGDPFAIEALAEGCLGVVGAAAAAKDLAVTSAIDASLPRRLVGDEGRLRQILLNLLNNAVKFTPRGSVALALRHEGSGRDGERIRFSVADTGIGIPADKQGRLFERFSQVDSSIRRDYGGTGLGLAISRRLVEAMGGEIGVISEAGRGATFWFTLTLPRAGDRAGDRASDQAAPEARAAAPGRPGRLLLVEDIEVNRELACLMLRAAGHSVDVATDGFQAVRAVEAGAYDLVLMDVQMPGLDGTMATRLIRCLPGAAARVPVVAMTANVLPDQVQSFRDAGMDDHLGKPFTPAELTAVLARWLDRAPAAPAEDEPAAFDQTLYDGVRAVLPPEAVGRLLGHLAEQVTGALAGEGGEAAERARLRFEAHGLVSAAGMLGFAALSRACAALEACGEDEVARDATAFAAALARARARCTAAAFETRRLRAEAANATAAPSGLGLTA
ncbi:PAS domain-containing hybrid sensor histidine kinase/response regulator [Methylobacterium platani]|uniref:histidine kinase n=1 Tax=Methylobacterium platani TaxID=427683 RepID=A0A179S724_9HYPH|nr:PAS domain-containing hybrid sensor histidine kinase/response regulator [Methylobacterium platani]OAS23131.1 hypothetical protein A5481_17605 [Methylobacterium platani]